MNLLDVVLPTHSALAAAGCGSGMDASTRARLGLTAEVEITRRKSDNGKGEAQFECFNCGNVTTLRAARKQGWLVIAAGQAVVCPKCRRAQ